MTHDQFMQHLMQQYPHPFYQSFLEELGIQTVKEVSEQEFQQEYQGSFVGEEDKLQVTIHASPYTQLEETERIKRERLTALLQHWHAEHDEEDEDDLLASFLFRRDEGMREEEGEEQVSDDDDDPPTIGAVLAYCACLEQTIATMSARLEQVKRTYEQTQQALNLARDKERARTNARYHLSEVVELYGLATSIEQITMPKGSHSFPPSPPTEEVLFADQQLLHYERRGSEQVPAYLCVLARPLSPEQIRTLDCWVSQGKVRSYTVHRYYKTGWSVRFEEPAPFLSVGIFPEQFCYGDYPTGKWYMVYQTGYTRELVGLCRTPECRGHASKEEACAHYAEFLRRQMVCFPRGQYQTPEAPCTICGTLSRGVVVLGPGRGIQEIRTALCPVHQSPKVLQERLTIEVTTPTTREGQEGPIEVHLHWKPLTRKRRTVTKRAVVIPPHHKEESSHHG